MNSNVVARVALVALAVPSLYAAAIFLPFCNHLVLALVVFVFTAGSGYELAAMLSPSPTRTARTRSAALSCLAPVAVYLRGLAGPPADALNSWLAPLGASVLVGLIVAALPLAFPGRSAGMPDAARKAGAEVLAILYPGAAASAVVALLDVPGRGGLLVIWFTMFVFANDSLAWLVGITLGRRRGIFPVSPNKSLEGLLAGLAGSVAAGLLGPVIFPGLVPRAWGFLAFMGLACGFLVVAGDLFESALKRSATIKDSGAAIPGRGGFLDSTDSLFFTAPAFVAFVAYLGLL